MAIRSFDVGGIRSLSRAHADDLPNLVGIAGPNGAGKSTLLEAIRSRRDAVLEPGSELLYVGPHRSWRSSQLSDMHVLGFPMDFEDVLKQESIPSFSYGQPTGLHFLGGLVRQAATADDSQALVKTSIVRLNNQQRTLVHEQYQSQGGQVAPGTVPDIIGPFRALVETLLPHLRLEAIDHSQNQNIRVLFRRTDFSDGTTFDIDDLSSGEKAAIALFLPFVEREAKRLQGLGSPPVAGVVPITVLLDEPEIHLHPLLQLNVLEYMRRLATEERAQFIFATQSPVLLDSLDDNELFLLSPPGFVIDNQLSRLSGSAERLEIARSLTGSTHLLTRGKPIVFVEGESDDGFSPVTDERLLKLLVPWTSHWAIAPARGRTDVINASAALRGAALHLPGMPVFGLIDSDTDAEGLPDYVVPWPVAMIENLLLDAGQLWTLIEPYSALTNLHSAAEVESSFRDIAEARVDEEIRLRIKQSLPGKWIAVQEENAMAIEAALQRQFDDLHAAVEAADPAEVASSARARVEEILQSDQATERFHGKAFLRGFYRKHDLGQAFSWAGFLTECARVVGEGGRAERLALPAVERIRLYFPPDLNAAIAAIDPSPDRDGLLEEANHHRLAWERGSPDPEGREPFRERLGQLARQQQPEIAHRLFGLANSVGTA